MNGIRNISSRRVRRSLLAREDISLIIIDGSVQNESKFLSFNEINHCFVFRYTNLSQCIKHFKKAAPREYIILLLMKFDNDKIQMMISQLIEHHQLQAVFILQLVGNKDGGEEKPQPKLETETSVVSNGKLVQRFEEWNPLFTSLQNHITTIGKSFNDTGLFTTKNAPEKALRDLKHEMGSFIWTHTFRVLLMDMPHNSVEAKRQMLRECRKHYYHYPSEKKEIAKFEKTYRPCDAIKWYTRPGFLSYLVNKTLRSKNAYALYIFRFFIFDLCESLALARYRHLEAIFVYRGTILARDEVEKLRKDSLVSTNGFLSSSCSREVALLFANSNRSRSRTESDQLVLFKIGIDLNQSPDVIVAYIGRESQIPDEEEFLFDLGTTFIITSTSYDSSSQMWNIEMNGSNAAAQHNREYDEYMRKRLLETSASVLFGRMLAHLSEYALAIKYFHRLLRALPAQHEDRPNIHYQLARMYRFLGKHQQALHYFRCAKLLRRRDSSCNAYEYGMILAGMGTVYLELNDSRRALGVLEQASIYYDRDPKNDNTETIFHYNRLSYAYYLEQQYERAVQLSNKALAFYKDKMPADHPGHAQTYHNLGLVHRAMGNMNEALTTFKEALRMRESLLAPTHPYVARTCYQMSLLYEECKNYQLALELANKALNIQRLKLSSNHAELQLSNELIMRLISTNHDG